MSYTEEPYCNPVIKSQLLAIKDRVLNKDRDFVAVYDGEEGVGKSVLAMQHAKILDPSFCLERVVFTAEQFIKMIRSGNMKKGQAIVLDEAFSSANSRASLSEVNRSMIALATEMRQKNLFVLLVLPTFFDLDRYFALWRCRALFHVYFTPNEDRHYIVFDKATKKLLYLNGKKRYDYTKPKAPFPPSEFFNQYVVDEKEYRAKKAEAFKGRTVSNRARQWLLQRNALIQYIIEKNKLTQPEINDIFKYKQVEGISQTAISFIMQGFVKEEELEEEKLEVAPLSS